MGQCWYWTGGNAGTGLGIMLVLDWGIMLALKVMGNSSRTWGITKLIEQIYLHACSKGKGRMYILTSKRSRTI